MNREYYNLRKHRIVILIKIIVAFLLIVFTIPWLIGVIGWTFALIPVWNGERGLPLDVVPNFLGGAVGILLGFFIENLYVNQLKALSQYEAICKSLEYLFDNIEKECRSLTEDCLFHLHSEIFDEIMNSVEKDSLFHGLPIYWSFIRKSRDKDTVNKIYEALHKINGDLRHIENQLYCYEKTRNQDYATAVVKRANTLLTDIASFKGLVNLKAKEEK